MIRRPFALLVGLALLPALALPVWAQAPTGAPAPKPAPKAAPADAAPKKAPDAKPAKKTGDGNDEDGPKKAEGKLPPGHPPPGSGMPPGHAAGGPPPGHGGRGPGGGFTPPKDRLAVAPDLPPGVVDVQIVDGNERPLANAPVTLTVLKNTVTEGESRREITGHCDEEGRYHFKGLPTGTGISYRVSTNRDEGRFTSTPFGLKDKNGVRVYLHGFDVVRELKDAPFVMEAVVLLDVKQDSIAVNHLLRTLNIGRQAYVATDVKIPLPEGAKAFNQGESPISVGMVEVDDHMELTGTFPPGEAEMTYRYNVPLDGSEANLKIPLPPRVVASRVVVGAGPNMGMEVAGYPEAKSGRWQDGKRVLQTTKQSSTRSGLAGLMQNTSPTVLDIRLTGLPSSGSAPLVALALALLAAAGGFGYLFTHRDTSRLADDQREDLMEARDALLGEFEVLERARKKGDIGPRTYGRLRTALLDALARIMSRLELVRPRPARATAGGSRDSRGAASTKATKRSASKKTKPTRSKGGDDGDARPRKKRRKRRSPAKAEG